MAQESPERLGGPVSSHFQPRVSKTKQRQHMATLIGLLPRDELQLVLRMLTDRDIVRMTCTCTILRDVSAVHILRRITQSELGQGLLQRVINMYATVTTPVFDDTTQLD